MEGKLMVLKRPTLAVEAEVDGVRELSPQVAQPFSGNVNFLSTQQAGFGKSSSPAMNESPTSVSLSRTLNARAGERRNSASRASHHVATPRVRSECFTNSVMQQRSLFGQDFDTIQDVPLDLPAVGADGGMRTTLRTTKLFSTFSQYVMDVSQPFRDFALGPDEQSHSESGRDRTPTADDLAFCMLEPVHCVIKQIQPELRPSVGIPVGVFTDLKSLTHLGSRHVEETLSVSKTVDGTIVVVSKCIENAMPVSKWSPSTEDDVLFLIRDICRALRYCSAHKISHLHMRRANVFCVVDPESPEPTAPTFVVSGFGLARLFQELSASEIWDLGYHEVSMYPPELILADQEHHHDGDDCHQPSTAATKIRRENLSAEAMDIWAVGCIAFELLFACHMYENDDDGISLTRSELFDIISSDHTVPFPWSSGVGPTARAEGCRKPPSPEIVKIIHTMLSKKPAERGTFDGWLKILGRRSAVVKRLSSTFGMEPVPMSSAFLSPLLVSKKSHADIPIGLSMSSSRGGDIPNRRFSSTVVSLLDTNGILGSLFTTTSGSGSGGGLERSVRCCACGEQDLSYLVCSDCGGLGGSTGSATTNHFGGSTTISNSSSAPFCICRKCYDSGSYSHPPNHTLIPYVVGDVVVPAAATTAPKSASLSLQRSLYNSIARIRKTSNAARRSSGTLRSGTVVLLDDSVVQAASPPASGGQQQDPNEASTASSTSAQQRLIPVHLLSEREQSILEMSGTLVTTASTGLLDHERRLLTRKSLRLQIREEESKMFTSNERDLGEEGSSSYDVLTQTQTPDKAAHTAGESSGRRASKRLSGTVHSSSIPPHNGSVRFIASPDVDAPPAEVLTAGKECDMDEACSAEELIDECVQLKSCTLLLNDLNLISFPTQILEPVPLVFISVLDLANNQLSTVPESLEYLVNLRRLLLGNNSLQELPDSIGNLTDLETVDVNHNQLSTLPQSLMFCDQLETLALDYNAFVDFPLVTLDMPSLKTLYLIQNAIDSWPTADELTALVAPLDVSVDNRPRLVAIPPASAHVRVQWCKRFPDEIIPGLFLGSVRTGQSQDAFEMLNIKYVLTVGRGLDVLTPLDGKRKEVVVDDLPGSNIDFAFDEAAEFIDEAIAAGLGVLVHCFAGMSRSATTVIAYLMMRRGMRLDEAYCLTKRGRPAIYPNAGFFDQLVALDAKLFPGQRPLDMASMERDKAP